jgi:CheY-like chemotaxis protein
MAGGRRILVVDDNADAAETLRLALGGRGVVQVAASGPAALAVLEEFAPDLVFLDIGMPGMDGHEVARRIRAAGHQELTLVAISGFGQEDMRRRSREAGINVHLVKPVDVEQIEALIDTL